MYTEKQNSEQFVVFLSFDEILNSMEVSKVLSLLEACFYLISSPLPSMKIQIMGGKVTENLGFQSLLRNVKFLLSFFRSFSNSP